MEENKAGNIAKQEIKNMTTYLVKREKHMKEKTTIQNFNMCYKRIFFVIRFFPPKCHSLSHLK